MFYREAGQFNWDRVVEVARVVGRAVRAALCRTITHAALCKPFPELEEVDSTIQVDVRL